MFVPFQSVQRVASDYWYHTCCDMYTLPHRANMWDWRIVDREDDWISLEFLIDKAWLSRFPGGEYGFDVDPRPTLTTQDLFWNRIPSMQKGWLARSSWAKARLALRFAPDVTLENIWRTSQFILDWLRPGQRYAFRMHNSPQLRGEVIYGIYRGIDCPLCVKLSQPTMEDPLAKYNLSHKYNTAETVGKERLRRWRSLFSGSYSYLVETEGTVRKIWSRNLEAITGT